MRDSDIAYEKIKKMLITCELKPGERLDELQRNGYVIISCDIPFPRWWAVWPRPEEPGMNFGNCAALLIKPELKPYPKSGFCWGGSFIVQYPKLPGMNTWRHR